MWDRGVPLAIVTAIAGRRQYRAALTGRANHAGSTSMQDRQDALAGAAEIMVELERLARALSPQTVATVGQIEALPGALNVIPGEVRFAIDFRSPDDALLAEGHVRLNALIAAVAERRGLGAMCIETEAQPATPLDAGVCAGLRVAAERTGQGALPDAVSGALHDAAILAPHLPTAMLFVASEGGIRHNPAEFSRVEDVRAAAEVLWALVAEDP